MADLGLDALEDWSAHIPRHIMQPYYKDVLPLLDGYLKNSTSTGTNRQKVVSLKGEENIFFFHSYAQRYGRGILFVCIVGLLWLEQYNFSYTPKFTFVLN